MRYQNYVFDLYGTLVDIHTDEEQQMLWEKMAMFYGYQGAFYTPAELHDAFYDMVHDLEDMQKSEMLKTGEYAHEAFPEIQIEDRAVPEKECGTGYGFRDPDRTVFPGAFHRIYQTL